MSPPANLLIRYKFKHIHLRILDMLANPTHLHIQLVGQQTTVHFKPESDSLQFNINQRK